MSMKTLIPAQKQTVWGWPAVANFSLGGMGTGLYLSGVLLLALRGGDLPAAGMFKLGGPALAGLGLLALTSEAGRPLRGLNLLRHLGRSWMSREALAAAIFIPAAVLEYFLPHPVLFVIAMAACCVLMVSQGFIVYRSRGVTAWNSGIIPFLYVTSGLVSGFGLTALLIAAGLVTSGPGLTLWGLVCAAGNLALWLLYLRLPGTDFRDATRALRTPYWLGLTLGAGHLLPILLLIGAPAVDGIGAALLMALTGGTLILGGVLQKVGIILGAGYLHPIQLGSRSVPPNHAAHAAP